MFFLYLICFCRAQEAINQHSRRKYSQTIHPARDQYAEYIKSERNQTAKEQIAQFKIEK
jgi:hypothetical protein